MQKKAWLQLLKIYWTNLRGLKFKAEHFELVSPDWSLMVISLIITLSQGPGVHVAQQYLRALKLLHEHVVFLALNYGLWPD